MTNVNSFINSRIWKTAVLFTYTVLTIILAIKHEPWFDEGQAWLLARDASIKELVWKYLRYEGSTGLWHLVLVPFAKLGFPYHSINFISVAIAIAGVYVFIRYSPFPAIIKTVFPFTYFIFYQYAVVARSYVLMPLVMFSIAIVYKKRYSKPGLFIILNIILANINLHGFIIASAILGVNFLDIISRWKSLTNAKRIKHVLSYMVFALMGLCIIAILWPPQDLEVGKVFMFNLRDIIHISKTTLMDSLTTNALFQVTPYTQPYLIFTIVTAAVTLLISVLWFKSSKTLLLYTAMTLPLLALFSVKYVSVWHEGILFLVWIFVLWISLEDNIDRFGGRRPVRNFKIFNNNMFNIRMLMYAAILVVFAVQITWSGSVSGYDYSGNYSASRDVAKYIKDNNLEGKKIYATSFHSVSILPYFKENILANYNNGQKKPSFWLWSVNNTTPRDSSELSSIIKAKPDLIILSVKIDTRDNCLLNIPGYTRLPEFEGTIFWKDVKYEEDTFILYRKKTY